MAEYTNSSLATYTQLSPNHSGKRTHAIDRITIHCIVGQASCKTLCNLFAKPEREASSNYGVCTDGICLIVDEANRSWCSSSRENDQRAITIEVASDTKEPYAVRGAVYEQLLELVYDICKRNGKTKLLWFDGDKEKTLAYEPKANEMVLTVHRWFANKSCPGKWLFDKHREIADKTTARLQADLMQDNGNGTFTQHCEFWKNGKCTKDATPEVAEPKQIKVGAIVKIVGTKYYNGKTIPSWVKNKQWYVYSIGGNRVVINKSVDGKNEIMSPIHINDLQAV